MSRFIEYFKSRKVQISLSLLAVGLLVCFDIFAATSPTGALTITAIQTNVAKSVGKVSQVLMDVATISGVGFVFASFFKFHQHKLNPTQVPLSNGVVLLLVGAGLCVFPHLIGTGSGSLFGTKAFSRAGDTAVESIVSTNT